MVTEAKEKLSTEVGKVVVTDEALSFSIVGKAYVPELEELSSQRVGLLSGTFGTVSVSEVVIVFVIEVSELFTNGAEVFLLKAEKAIKTDDKEKLVVGFVEVLRTVEASLPSVANFATEVGRLSMKLVALSSVTAEKERKTNQEIQNKKSEKHFQLQLKQNWKQKLVKCR